MYSVRLWWHTIYIYTDHEVSGKNGEEGNRKKEEREGIEEEIEEERYRDKGQGELILYDDRGGWESYWEKKEGVLNIGG